MSHPLLIPERLVTQRLTLRRPVEADRAAYVAFYTSDRSAMALGPKTPPEASDFFDAECAMWRDRGFGMYTVTLGDTPIGLIGMWEPDGWPEAELGWLLWEGYEGKGYAREAALAVLSMWRGLGRPAPISIIDHDNTASQNLARAMGAQIEGPHPKYDDCAIWRHAQHISAHAGLVPGIASIETDRLILRTPAQGDLDAFADFLADPERMTHLSGVVNRAGAWRGLIGGIGHWQWWGCGFWHVVDKATGAMAGRVGILRHDDWPEPELAWHLFAGYEGKSIAYEAALAARRDAYTRLGLGPVISIIAKDNTRSIALATRLGAVAERDYLHDSVDCTIYRHPKEAA